MSDPNEGSVVLFRRGIRPDGSAFGEWEVGYVRDTFFVDGEGQVCAPTFDRPDQKSWLTIIPAAAEGASAPTTVTVPLDFDHIDPVVHGTEIGPFGRRRHTR